MARFDLNMVGDRHALFCFHRQFRDDVFMIDGLWSCSIAIASLQDQAGLL